MPTGLNRIELQTHTDAALLRLSDIEKFGDGSGYRCNLTVKSKSFACELPFYFDDSHLRDGVDALSKMKEGSPGEAVIKGQWEDSVIRFALDHLGHLVVSGELFEHAELSQSLRFAFATDQTVLGPLVRDLTALLGR